MPGEFVSILMLTHNAPDYVARTIDTLRRLTRDVAYELVVVDNASQAATVKLVRDYEQNGAIDTLILSETNTLFAAGNNIAARAAQMHASHFLLLNSDVQICHPGWLRHLLNIHERGISSYGVVADMLRVDGYCLLIDADLYHAHRLDEAHGWWWSVTKLQAELLNRGHRVQGYFEHQKYIHHFGGRSGRGFADARGMDVSRATAQSWFNGHSIKVLDPDRLWRYKLSKLINPKALMRYLQRRYAAFRKFG